MNARRARAIRRSYGVKHVRRYALTMDHTWNDTLEGSAVIGFRSNPRRLQIFAPDPLAFVLTGHIAALSFEHGCGKKIVLGIPWLRQIEERARILAEDT